MPAIGLSGFGKVGKTTAAQYIEQTYGFERRHIATPLRAMAAALLKANGISDEMIHRYLEGDLKDGVIIPELGVTSRQLQVSLGTEWGRKMINPDLWAETWKRSVKDGEMVMNDSVRFANEEKVITDLKGINILIERDGTGPIAWKRFFKKLGPFLYRTFGWLGGAHDSERTDRLSPTYRIKNNGSMAELYHKIDEIMLGLGYYPQRMIPGE